MDSEDSTCSINTKLRERYVETLLKLQGSACQLQCHERTSLSATFQTISPTSDYIILSRVQTPTDSIQQCAIRQSDVLTLTWPNKL